MGNKFEIKWEEDSDDDFASVADLEDKQESQDFATLLAGEAKEPAPRSLRAGAKVAGQICHIPQHSEQIVVALSSKDTAVIDKKELMDTDQNLQVKLGDRIEGYIVSNKNGEIILSLSMDAKQSREQGLHVAFQAQMPIKAKVVAVNKGGYELLVVGKKGFCPLSQMATHFVEEPSIFIGKEFEFLIKKLDSHDIVLSRAELLRRSAVAFAEELAKKIEAEEKPTVSATVIAFKDFGLIVDIGQGLEALLHKKEMGYANYENLKEHFSIAQKLQVLVTAVTYKDSYPRVSVSLKGLMDDPWDNITKYSIGQSLTGEVIRLSDFGAFVQLEPGIVGLVHISEMSSDKKKRILHPRELVSVGQKVTVRILQIDSAQQKLSLSLRAYTETEEGIAEEAMKEYEDYQKKQTEKKVASPTGTLGLLLQEQLNASATKADLRNPGKRR